MSYPIVLHPDILEFLRENTLHQFPEQVWKCLQKIKQGSFDGGLRVKKLKGIFRGVWEARINQSSRIIFTYQNSIESSSDPTAFYLPHLSEIPLNELPYLITSVYPIYLSSHSLVFSVQLT